MGKGKRKGGGGNKSLLGRLFSTTHDTGSSSGGDDGDGECERKMKGWGGGD